MTIYLDTFKQAIKPDPYITISEWAEANFVLPKESTKEHGKYRIDRTPFVREVLDELSPMSAASEVVLIKPTQLAGTTIGIIFLMCIADLYPGPCLFITVTESLAKRFSKKRITPSIKLIPCLKDKIKTMKTRDSQNTILVKEFPGGSWLLAGSNAAASYRSEPAKYVILDDYDGFDMDIEGEGDPGELADRRTGSFADSKIYKNSTPTVKGASNIERDWENTSQGLFQVPCPHCMEYQYLVWGGKDSSFGIKFTRDDNGQVDEVWYECKFCHNRIDEHKKPWMLERGKYVHKYPERTSKRGFKYNALYSPLGWKNTWKIITEKFLAATREAKEGKPQKLKAWTNTMMADSWEERGASPEWEVLSQRRETYAEKFVPHDGLFLSCGVDTQDNRLAVLVRAWGVGEESWLIYHTEIWGDPNQDDVWDKLDMILNAGYQHESGHVLQIQSTFIDAMGHRTQPVYNYCRLRAPRIYAIQGIPGENKPIVGFKPTLVDVNFAGQVIKEGCQLWKIGVHQAKVTIYSRLNMPGHGAGVYHWHQAATDEYFKQLTAERLVLKYVKGYPRYEWTKEPGRANEALDIEVYAYAAAIRYGMNQPGFWPELKRYFDEKSKKKEEKPIITQENGRKWVEPKTGWLNR